MNRCRFNEKRQDSNTRDLIFGVEALMSRCLEFYTQNPGDTIMTGSPSGMGPVGLGVVMDCEIEGIGRTRVEVRGQP